MKDIQAQVEAFLLGQQSPGGRELPTSPGTWISEKSRELCIKLIKEEYKELMDAIEANDFIEMIDGAADLIFVILWLMVKTGIPLEEFWEEVCRTNMAKLHGPLHPETGKQMKPPGWEPPRIKEFFELLKKRHELIKDRPFHILKTAPRPFAAILKGEKKHEWRRHDRNFMVGDLLVLREWVSGQCGTCGGKGRLRTSQDESEDCDDCNGTGSYYPHFSGREIVARVTFKTTETDMTEHYQVALSPETRWVVMTIEPIWTLATVPGGIMFGSAIESSSPA
jgi:NTP pyrophosphatase (non-canonical NTP hydrolase)